MTEIRLMDVALANKIAAGEVVERPASVIKELVENALDAGATQIDIQVEEAGLKNIEVTDNGRGMSQVDAELSFERHATSKIVHHEDLFRIQTLGFRGEALPSIASVSKMTLETAKASGPGSFIAIEGGEIVERRAAASRQGTKIQVKSLFYNTPARLKYMSSLNTELSHISNLINRFALAHADVAFRLYSDGKNILRSSGNGDVLQSLAAVYGVETARKMLKIEGEDFDFKVFGYTSSPEMTRASRNYMTLIINGRYVRHYALNRAIETAYGSKLMINRHPITLLFIETDPYLLDVNVHPTKQTIRISNEKQLGQLIKKIVNDALQANEHIPSGLDNIDVNRRARSEEKFTQTRIELPSRKINSKDQEEVPRNKEELYTQSNNTFVYEDLEELLEEQMHVEENPLVTAKKRLKKPNINPTIDVFPELEYIGQMHGTYLLAQNEAGLYVIDQHAAQERVKYEYFRVEVGRESSHQQRFLLPEILEYPLDQALLIQEKLPLLEKIGLKIETFGDRSFIMRSHPIWFEAGQEEATAREMIDFLLTENDLSLAAFREATAIMMSCKRSIKANHSLSSFEVSQLLYDLTQCENPYHCPHGRPVLVKITVSDLEKMFKRVQD